MAENQQDNPVKSRLNDLPGWKLRSPGHVAQPAATPHKDTPSPAPAPKPVAAKPPEKQQGKQQEKPPQQPKPQPKPAPAAAPWLLQTLADNFKTHARELAEGIRNRLSKKSLAWKGVAASLVASTTLAIIFSQNASQPETENTATPPPTASTSGKVVMGTGPEYAPAAQAKAPSAAEWHGRVARSSKTPRTANRAPLETDLSAHELSGMISPLEAYELTDHKPTRGFGRLFHPIRKRMKHHDGVDFKAQEGTPVYAVSNGTIKEQGWKRGYGKTIRLAHSRSMESLYAHLDRFAKGIRRGSEVKQGDLIGYVGSTGLSTGPHLHFEIRKNDVPVDPLKVAAQVAATPAQNTSGAFAKAGNNTRIRTSSHKIDSLIAASAAREGLDPTLISTLFVKEAGDVKTGKINPYAVSDKGATGLCQFTKQTFLGEMKQHGDRLGFGKYAGQIKTNYSREDGITRHTAGNRENEILKLRFKPEVAIPLCAAHIRDDLDYLQSRINRPPNFTDSSLSHFTGAGVAKNLILAYMNPQKRKDPAYTYADPINYEGPTNRRVFFHNGNFKKPYTVEQVYKAKMRIMGTAPALASDDTRSAAALSPARQAP